MTFKVSCSGRLLKLLLGPMPKSTGVMDDSTFHILLSIYLSLPSVHSHVVWSIKIHFGFT